MKFVRHITPAHWARIAVGVAFGLLMWRYMNTIWRPPGNLDLSDISPTWEAARQLWLLHGDPYAPSIGFVYPAYLLLLLAPIAYISFGALKIASTWVLWLLAGASALVWNRSIATPLPKRDLAFALVLVLGSFPILEGARLQNLSLLAAALLAFAFAAVISGRLRLAGVVLGLAMIKPQFAIPAACWMTIWTLRAWRRRQAFLWALGGCVGLLLLASQWAVPGWLGAFLAAGHEYLNYNSSGSILQVLFTPLGGTLAAAALVLVVSVACWKRAAENATSTEFSVVFALCLAVVPCIFPTIAPPSQLLLVPGLFLLARAYPRLRQSGAVVRQAANATWILLAWQWVGALLLLGHQWFFPNTPTQKYWVLPLATLPLVPLAVTILLIYLAGNPSLLEGAKPAPREANAAGSEVKSLLPSAVCRTSF